MSCFLLLKNICDGINSQLTSFWWGQTEGKRKISWISWRKLCLQKTEGGMGFRDLYAFNKALLAKEAWKIEQNHHFLLARLYKGRYYNSLTFLQSTSSTTSSYGWKYTQARKELLKKGLIMKIVDGMNTRIWEDQWLPALPPQKIISPCLVPDMTVAELINPITGTWDEDKLSHLLLPEDIELVQQIRLSKYNRHDQYVWPYTTNMEYTVKSGYWTTTHDFYEGDDIVQPEGSISIKRMIWKLDILPQIQHFLWRTVSGALPTYVQLCSRGINTYPDCQICCLEEESINHTLFLCLQHL